MVKMGSEADARLMLPYYPLVIVPILLLPAQKYLLHLRGWKVLMALAALSVLPAAGLSARVLCGPRKKFRNGWRGNIPAARRCSGWRQFIPLTPAMTRWPRCAPDCPTAS